MTELLKMINSMKKQYDHLCLEVCNKYQLTRVELDILLFLHNNPSCDSAKDIVEKRGIIKSHASLGIEKLVKKNCLEVTRDEKDKRRYHLHLTARTVPMIEDGLVAQKKFHEILYHDFNEEERIMTKALFKRMYTNIINEEEKK